MSRLIFHIDVNSAFLSWGAARQVSGGRPDLWRIPSAIGGDRDKKYQAQMELTHRERADQEADDARERIDKEKRNGKRNGR